MDCCIFLVVYFQTKANRINAIADLTLRISDALYSTNQKFSYCARVGCAAWVPGVFVNARFRILKLKLSRSFYGTHTLEA